MNLVAELRSRNGGRVDDVAIRWENESKVTYGELFDRAAQYAAALRSVGVSPGDRVIVQVAKSVENMALYLGVLHVGAVFVPLNTAYTAGEVDYFVNDASPTVVVVDPRAENRHGDVIVWTLDETGSGTAATAADAEATTLPVVARDPEDAAAMVFTSGTTGRSKGAVLSHRALINNTEALVDCWAFNDQDVLVHVLPIFHVHGLFVALHCPWWVGAHVHAIATFDAAVVRSMLADATVFMGVPTHYTRLLAEGVNGHDCASVRLFTAGSAPMTTDTHRAFTQATGHRIVERYGMSEAGMITSNPYRDKPQPGQPEPGTVGFALPGVEIRIADESGAETEVDQIGGVQIRSTSLFSGYWNQPEKTSESFVDGWFITGDVGALDVDGRLSLEGRASDMIITGGLNVYPKEIEMALDAIDGVTESAVVGVPHPDFGEAVIAVIVGKADQSDVNAALTSSLARFKHPKFIDWVDTLPRNAMGKVQKNELRDHYDKMFSHGL